MHFYYDLNKGEKLDKLCARHEGIKGYSPSTEGSSQDCINFRIKGIPTGPMPLDDARETMAQISDALLAIGELCANEGLETVMYINEKNIVRVFSK